MEFRNEVNLAKKLVLEGYEYKQLVNYFAKKKLYHTVALLIFKEVFEVDLYFAKEQIYMNEYYSHFKNEINPFNNDFIDE